MEAMIRRARTRKTLLAIVVAVFAALSLTASSAAAATTLAVTSVNDESGTSSTECVAASEKCTLRAAVERADKLGGEVTISVPAGEYSEEISPYTLTAADGAKISIVGAGAGKTNINGNGSDSVLRVESGGSLLLDGATVMHGRSYEGGGGGAYVENDGALTLENALFIENEAREYGGALHGEFGSTIVVKHSAIDDNHAFLGGGIFGEWGSSIAIEDESTIEEDVATYGGGVYSEEGATTTVADSSVRRDTAVEDGGGIAESERPGCETPSLRPKHHPSPDIAQPIESGLAISRATIAENSALKYAGGGIYVGPTYTCPTPPVPTSSPLRPDVEIVPGEPQVTVTQSTIAGNAAGEESASGYGGGVFLDTFLEDPIIDSTITGNHASATGGGIAVEQGLESLVNDTVFDNTIVEAKQVDSEQSRALGKAGNAVRAWSRARKAAAPGTGVRPDTAGEATLAGGNLATESEGFAVIALRDTIVAEPEGSESENCGEGYVESLKPESGYNLDFPASPLDEEGYDACGLSEKNHDLLGRDPKLAPVGLHANGGPTETIALEAGSPAIGAVPTTKDCDEETSGPALPNEKGEPVAVDQRGVLRPGIPNSGCDIGAYEYQEPAKEPAQEPTATPASKEEPKPSGKTEVLSVKITSPTQCASVRDIEIHIQHVRQLGVVSATVSIDGKQRRTLSGKRLRTAIDLRGLPKGTFTVEIVARTRGGRTLHGQRVYHTCHTKLPGHSFLKL
jgi:hypothetical protein